MKKFAVKGLVILGIIVLLCIFFSGTLHTITTAKVRIAKARSGHFEKEITMTGSLLWPDTVSLTVDGMTDDDTLIIRRLPVSAGSYVREGDLIAECSVVSFETRLAAMQASYSAKEKEYLELERKNSAVILTDQQQRWFDVYRSLQDAGNTTQLLRQDLRLEAWKAGITLGEGDTLPENCEDESLLELSSRLAAAEETRAAAEKAFDQMKRLNISEDVITYLDRKEELQQEMEELTADMTALRILNEQSASVRAPHSGYITALELKAGDQVGMDTALVIMTAPDTEPVIRLDPGDSRYPVDAGTAVVLSAGDNTADSVICGQGVSPDGGMYVDAAVSRSVLGALGGTAAVAEENAVTAKLVCRSENVSTLIPVTALRGTAGNYYIYTASSYLTALGAERFTAARKNVTVLGMNNTVASVEESLKSDTVVYMEDRPISDGCEVMPYDEQ